MALSRPDQRLYPWTAQGALSPLTVTGARGSWFFDAEGNRHLDLGGQLAYMNIGHGHPRVVEAIRRQAAELPVIGPNFATRPAARLAEMLAEVTPGDLTGPSSPTAAPRRSSTPSGSPARPPDATRSSRATRATTAPRSERSALRARTAASTRSPGPAVL